MKRIVINELRAHRRRLVSKGVEAKVVKSARFYHWYTYHFIACAYNPATHTDNYLVVKEEAE